MDIKSSFRDLFKSHGSPNNAKPNLAIRQFSFVVFLARSPFPSAVPALTVLNLHSAIPAFRLKDISLVQTKFPNFTQNRVRTVDES